MSLERQLAHLDYRIYAARGDVETFCALDWPEQRREEALDKLEALLREREDLRRRYVRELRWQSFLAEVGAMWRRLTKELLDFANRPEVRKLVADLRALGEDPPRPRPAFWRAVVSADADTGSLGRSAFSAALPANSRPTLPGHMKQKGRG